MNTEYLDEAAWQALPFNQKLAHVSSLADSLGRREGRIGFFFKHDEGGKNYDKLSSTYCVALKNSKELDYGSKTIAVPNMISIIAGVWHGGIAYWGTTQFRESRHKQGVVLPHPAKDFKKMGNVRDFKERRLWRQYAFNEQRPWDHHQVSFGRMLFDEDLMRGKLVNSSPQEPHLLCRVPCDSPLEWLTLRKEVKHLESNILGTKTGGPGKRFPVKGSMSILPLYNVVEKIVTTKGYSPCNCSVETTAPCDGIVKVGENRSYHFSCDDVEGKFEKEISNPTELVRSRLRNIFSMDPDIEMYPLYNNKDKGPKEVISGQPLYTPLKEQADDPEKKFTIEYLKQTLSPTKFDALCAFCAICTTRELDGVNYIAAELAYSSSEPIVYMDEYFPRVQRLEGHAQAFKTMTSDIVINMIEVPNRSLPPKATGAVGAMPKHTQYVAPQQPRVEALPRAIADRMTSTVEPGNRLPQVQADLNGNVIPPPAKVKPDVIGNILPPPVKLKPDVDGNRIAAILTAAESNK